MWTTIEPLDIPASALKPERAYIHNADTRTPNAITAATAFQALRPRLPFRTPSLSLRQPYPQVGSIYAHATRSSWYRRSGAEHTSGEGGIRTPDAGITDITVFETAAFNHSATSPRESVSFTPYPFNHHGTPILNHQTSLARSPAVATSPTVRPKFKGTCEAGLRIWDVRSYRQKTLFCRY